MTMSVISDFKTVYDHLQNKRDYCVDEDFEDLFEDPEEEMLCHEAKRRLTQLYRITPIMVDILAPLVHVMPNGIVFKKLYTVVKEDSSDVDDRLYVLEDRGFVRRGVVNGNVKFVRLTEEAFEAFKAGVEFGILPFNFIRELYETDDYRISSRDWMASFNSAIEKNPDSRFVKGWIKIGADKLDVCEQQALCMALHQFVTNFTKPFEYEESKPREIKVGMSIRDLDKNDGESSASVSFTGAAQSLLEKGFIERISGGYVINPDVAEALFHGEDSIVSYEAMATKVRVIKPSSITPKELFFTQESQEDIDDLRKMLSPAGFEHACSVLLRKKRNPAIHSLLWGGPGTGKTETVKQLALETGRDIFQFDVAMVTGGDWGDTEKHYRSLFREYRYVVAVKSLTPILFLNEADQVLGRRLTNLDRSIDKSENTVSNILLEEFENMHGILLATTNFAGVLDEAFDRRFLFKTELQKPNKEAQTKIWKSSIPELSADECEYLADIYNMSGAQISNVTAKRDLAELYYDGDRGLSYIEMLCQRELGSEKMTSTKTTKIGFGR